MLARTVYTLLDERANASGDLAALHQPIPAKKGETAYSTLTWAELRTAVQEIAAGLRVLGVGKGDVVALHSETRLEFFLADFGAMASGAISAALYTSYAPAQQVPTLNACGARLLLVESPKVMGDLRKALGAEHPIRYILLTGEADGELTLAELRGQGRAAMATDSGLFGRMQAEQADDDPAMLYLTSGATGEPKMGLVSHRAIVSNVEMAHKVLHLGPQDRTLVFLPSAHITQRLALQVLPVIYGMPVWFSEGLSKMPAELRRIQPTFWVAPPRVWERIYASACTEVRKRPAWAQKLFHGALGAGLKAVECREKGEPVPGWLSPVLALSDRLVFAKIRERLGGKLRVAVSGSAPLGRDIARFYEAIGLPLVEGYGLTEGGVVCLNPIDAPRIGTIGQLLPGVEARLSDDGELLLKSPTLFSGYFNDPASTAAVLRDGWLHTGDIAECDKDGFWFITGRKKELIVSSNGKKVYPSRIETLFKTEPLVNQVVLVGDRLPYMTALFTLNPAALELIPELAAMKGKPPAEVAGSPAVQEAMQQVVARTNRQLASFEQIRKFRILEREFTVDTGEMTPTMKVRRGKVLENHKAVVAEMYAGKEEFV